MDDADYCRQIEAYLCQKNGGHLVRIVGPAFELVCGWAEQGVPLKVACRGIDRCLERASQRGGRRRPMRIEFCEADVLEAFDDWRRALGVTAAQVSEGTPDGEWERPARKDSLPSHVDRSLSRLLAVKTDAPDMAFDDVIRGITTELDGMAAAARAVRGDARAQMIQRLAALDAELMEAGRRRLSAEAAEDLRREVDAELASFASRMPPEGLARARGLAFDRLVRDRLNLPTLTYE